LPRLHTCILAISPALAPGFSFDGANVVAAELPTIRYSMRAMGKFGWTAIGVLAAAFAADQYWKHGYYTDNAMRMLSHIRHSFGW